MRRIKWSKAGRETNRNLCRNLCKNHVILLINLWTKVVFFPPSSSFVLPRFIALFPDISVKNLVMEDHEAFYILPRLVFHCFQKRKDGDNRENIDKQTLPIIASCIRWPLSLDCLVSSLLLCVCRPKSGHFTHCLVRFSKTWDGSECFLFLPFLCWRNQSAKCDFVWSFISVPSMTFLSFDDLIASRSFLLFIRERERKIFFTEDKIATTGISFRTHDSIFHLNAWL